MKKIYFIILPLLLTLLACDNIGEDDRYIEVEPINPMRRVLLEEFTGQRCTNCPAAHAIIEKLEEQYGEDLIVVSIHAGNFGIASPDGLMQPEGNEYASRWGITAYPAGVVDREGPVLNADQWAAAIRTAMMEPTDLDIKIEASLNESGDSIEVNTTLSASAMTVGTLQLWVVESGIVGFQIDGSQRLPDYIHNNVFRAAINGLWGETITVNPNIYYNKRNTIALEEEWNIENLSVVGFVYDSEGVIQAGKGKVEN